MAKKGGKQNPFKGQDTVFHAVNDSVDNLGADYFMSKAQFDDLKGASYIYGYATLDEWHDHFGGDNAQIDV